MLPLLVTVKEMTDREQKLAGNGWQLIGGKQGVGSEKHITGY